MNKKILFLVGTHGDEPIGPALLDRLESFKIGIDNYESVIGNPRALQQNKRFTEIDLNRVAPGDLNSSIYEIKRAAELVNLFKRYDYIIDFHETKANNRIVIILPKLTRESIALALAFNIKEILIWPPSSPNTTTGPLVQCAPFGIEIECGTKTSFPKTLKKLEEIIASFLNNKAMLVGKDLLLSVTNFKKRRFYMVYDKIDPKEVVGINLKDFQEVSTAKERFIPLLFGKHQGLMGYKMRRIDNNEIFDILDSVNNQVLSQKGVETDENSKVPSRR